ncbi:MAG: type II CRISPR RNA-guided endonuclease Cas9 [Parafilimonas sp.]
MNKRILGLDLGTNSIGWALINQNDEAQKANIIKLGSRIIPMGDDVLGKFDSGITESDTAARTGFRGVRRLRARHLLRRERLHRVLNILQFLPEHYAKEIDFEKRLGQYLNEAEPKIAYRLNKEIKVFEFVFTASFEEMLEDFKVHQPQLLEDGRKVPYDWTIYYLRKKALTEKIAKEELVWLLLNFNHKRGYYQLRGEEEEDATRTTQTRIYFVTETIENIENTGILYKGLKIINVKLSNGETGKYFNKEVPNWIGQRKNIIITVDTDKNGDDRFEEDGITIKRKFSIPTDEDWEKKWKLIKIKTEKEIKDSKKTVGTYIYDTLLQNPKQKINGSLVRVIERKFYKEELEQILETQLKHHPELRDKTLYNACLEELYGNNEAHKSNNENKGFASLFLNDIIFYQRPLKSKKFLISDCKYESRPMKDKDGKLKKSTDGTQVMMPVKCIAKSHPLFQEFRLWQWLKNLGIYEKATDADVTHQFLQTEEDRVNLFEWLNDRQEVDHKALLTHLLKPLKLKVINYRWNYVYDSIKDESKSYPCNETRSQILSRLSKVENVPSGFLTKETEEALWHILYSVNDKQDIPKALQSFAGNHNLGDDFAEQFKKFPPFKSDYGSCSAKAIKKLLPLMRMGKYWNEADIHQQTRERISKIINAEYDEAIQNRVRDKAINLKQIEDFKGLPLWLTSYIVYNRHSEDGEIKKWKSVQDLENYLKEFKQHSLRNPIVEQVITETLRVVKDIWSTYGSGAENFFDEIHIELGREMKNPADKRKEMTNQITENENTNLRIKALLAEMMNDNNVENVRPYSPSQQEILRIYEDAVLNSGIEIEDDILKISKTAQPSKNDLVRYKLWLEQKYRSPYTGATIPLNKLFTTAYEIEHIIPQSRHFDDSFSNKVICEAEVNKLKDNMLGLEFIKSNYGQKVQLNFGSTIEIFTVDAYEIFVKDHYAKSRGKMKKLLYESMDDIPEKFIERQMNDTRYISKMVKNVLSNIVRAESKDDGTTSVNVLSSNGQITSTLKQDWGLNDVWNEIIAPRFERLNVMTNSNNFGSVNEKTGKFLPTVPLELSKGFTKKRIDHRHHALDALVIACATRNHINYLNNQNALEKRKSPEQKQKSREDLRSILCIKKYNEGSEKNYKWTFKKPWEIFTQEAKDQLLTTLVSFKQNLRVINKTVNKYDCWVKTNGILEKVTLKQTKGDSWAIRKPMHKDTVSGLVRLRFKKTVQLSAALDNWESIVDNDLRKSIKQLVEKKYDKKMLQKHFKDLKNSWNDKDISKVEIYYWDKENVASRVKLDDSFAASKIETITDAGIQKILLNHLNKEKYQEAKDEKGKSIAAETVAFSADGIDDLNKNIQELNGGKFHQPIYKVRTYEPKGNKFNVGQTGNKKDKFVVAADGTNLFFVIYKDEKGNRSYETIPLNIVIENQKQGALHNQHPNECSVRQINDAGNRLQFFLSPNDLVYLPTSEEQENPNLVTFENINSKPVKQIYKFIDGSGTTANFIPSSSATTIFNMNKKEQGKQGLNYPIQNEYGVGSPQSKNQKSLDGIMIKEHCWKLQVNRVGEIIKIIK